MDKIKNYKIARILLFQTNELKDNHEKNLED